MRINPASPDLQAESTASKEAAIALMRAKVAKALGAEPAAAAEIAQASVEKTPSKHQLFMRQLSESGKSLAEIQTEWHRYYTMLPDREKREVWQEFYDANQHTPYQRLFQKLPGRADQNHPNAFQPAPIAVSPQTNVNPPSLPVDSNHKAVSRPTRQPKTKAGLAAQKAKARVKKTIDKGEQLGINQHLRSLWFGIKVGSVVLIVLLFGFFNEMFIAPFIQPSRSDNTPIIMSDISTSNTAQATVIVPKINVQVPVDFNVPSVDEKTVQNSLKSGVVHYPSTVRPGQNGNGAYFGHSSQNILNSGKFKYAFISLHKLTTGDVFYITYQGKAYAYQVFTREVVNPSQVSVINDTKGKQATATLITCDPPGISTNRLVVWGEQISPSVSSNTTVTPPTDSSLTLTQITGKGDSAWTRFVRNIQFWKSSTSSQ